MQEKKQSILISGKISTDKCYTYANSFLNTFKKIGYTTYVVKTNIFDSLEKYGRMGCVIKNWYLNKKLLYTVKQKKPTIIFLIKAKTMPHKDFWREQTYRDE